MGPICVSLAQGLLVLYGCFRVWGLLERYDPSPCPRVVWNIYGIWVHLSRIVEKAEITEQQVP